MSRHIIYFPGSATPDGKHTFFNGFVAAANNGEASSTKVATYNNTKIRWSSITAMLVPGDELAQCLKDLDAMGEGGFRIKEVIL